MHWRGFSSIYKEALAFFWQRKITFITIPGFI